MSVLPWPERDAANICPRCKQPYYEFGHRNWPDWKVIAENRAEHGICKIGPLPEGEPSMGKGA